MKQAVELNILGKRLAIKSDKSEEHVREVEQLLSEKIAEIRESSNAVATLDLALLAALNITGELIEAKKLLEAIEERSEELTRRIESRKTGT
ncbi:MAG: cell division protein ZapA [Deltaproteobacteria bacterium]|nr:cell division protein ZapA [Deltaproteobacteria bacterium]